MKVFQDSTKNDVLKKAINYWRENYKNKYTLKNFLSKCSLLEIEGFIIIYRDE